MVSLGYVFILLAFVCLLVIARALFKSVRALSEPSEMTWLPTDAERSHLLEKKQRLLQRIRDLELEKALSKMTDEDYQRFQSQFREQAKLTMIALDDEIAPLRVKAEALIESARKKAKA